MCFFLLIFQQGTTYFMVASVLSMTPSVLLFMPEARIYWKEFSSMNFCLRMIQDWIPDLVSYVLEQ